MHFQWDNKNWHHLPDRQDVLNGHNATEDRGQVTVYKNAEELLDVLDNLDCHLPDDSLQKIITPIPKKRLFCWLKKTWPFWKNYDHENDGSFGKSTVHRSRPMPHSFHTTVNTNNGTTWFGCCGATQSGKIKVPSKSPVNKSLKLPFQNPAVMELNQNAGVFGDKFGELTKTLSSAKHSISSGKKKMDKLVKMGKDMGGEKIGSLSLASAKHSISSGRKKMGKLMQMGKDIGAEKIGSLSLASAKNSISSKKKKMDKLMQMGKDMGAQKMRSLSLGRNSERDKSEQNEQKEAKKSANKDHSSRDIRVIPIEKLKSFQENSLSKLMSPRKSSKKKDHRKRERRSKHKRSSSSIDSLEDIAKDDPADISTKTDETKDDSEPEVDISMDDVDQKQSPSPPPAIKRKSHKEKKRHSKRRSRHQSQTSSDYGSVQESMKVKKDRSSTHESSKNRDKRSESEKKITGEKHSKNSRNPKRIVIQGHEELEGESDPDEARLLKRSRDTDEDGDEKRGKSSDRKKKHEKHRPKRSKSYSREHRHKHKSRDDSEQSSGRHRRTDRGRHSRTLGRYSSEESLGWDCVCRPTADMHRRRCRCCCDCDLYQARPSGGQIRGSLLDALNNLCTEANQWQGQYNDYDSPCLNQYSSSPQIHQYLSPDTMRLLNSVKRSRTPFGRDNSTLPSRNPMSTSYGDQTGHDFQKPPAQPTSSGTPAMPQQTPHCAYYPCQPTVQYVPVAPPQMYPNQSGVMGRPPGIPGMPMPQQTPMYAPCVMPGLPYQPCIPQPHSLAYRR